jgi:hypothetical protein
VGKDSRVAGHIIDGKLCDFRVMARDFGNVLPSGSPAAVLTIEVNPVKMPSGRSSQYK